MKKPYIFILTFLLSFFGMFNIPESHAQADLLSEAKYVVDSIYVGNIAGDINSATSVQELMDMLDPYSDYYTYEEVIQLLNSIEQTTVGIGIIVEQDPAGVYVVTVIEGSSAENGGIKSGYIITHVDGKPIEGYNVDTATSLIKGEQGTSVSLTVKRPDRSIFNVTLERKAFSVPVVASKLLYGNVGYISLSSFSENAALEVKKAAENLQKQGVTSFILDLQNNTGGLVSSAQQLIGLFPNTTLAYIEHSKTQTKRITPYNLNYKFPNTTRVLINRYSASASDMTAAAILDQDAGILYGERSYGKGVMQGFYALSDGSMLKLTQAEFTGPNHTKINGVGITPHVTTSNPLQQAHFDAIKEKYTNYKPLKSFTDVPVDKTFTLTFSQEVATSLPEDAIELVTLGGNTIPFTLERNGEKLVITPSQPLAFGHHYVLLIHPNKLKSLNSNVLTKGFYSYITVVK